MEFLDPNMFVSPKPGPKPRPLTIFSNNKMIIISKRVIDASANEENLNLKSEKLELYILETGELIIKPGDKGFKCSLMKSGDVKIFNVSLCAYLWDKYKWKGKSAKLPVTFSEEGILTVITRQIPEKNAKN